MRREIRGGERHTVERTVISHPELEVNPKPPDLTVTQQHELSTGQQIEMSLGGFAFLTYARQENQGELTWRYPLSNAQGMIANFVRELSADKAVGRTVIELCRQQDLVELREHKGYVVNARLRENGLFVLKELRPEYTLALNSVIDPPRRKTITGMLYEVEHAHKQAGLVLPPKVAEIISNPDGIESDQLPATIDMLARVQSDVFALIDRRARKL